MKKLSGIFVMIIFLAGCQTMREKHPEPDPDNGGITLPKDFSSLVVSEGVGKGRHIVVNDNGDIYVSLARNEGNKGIACLRDNTGDGKADVVEYAGEHTGTGIKLHKGYIYFGSDTAIVRYPLPQGQLVPGGDWEMIARGFVHNPQHASKPMDFDGAGNMYVNVGAYANACQEQDRVKGSPGMDPCPILERAGGIWKFKDDVIGQDQMNDGLRYATGIRNAVALRWNNVVGELYAVQHGRDQLFQFYPELYDQKMGAELPSEEFFLVKEGSDFGWPYCFYDHLQNKKVLAPEYGGEGKIAGRCEGKDNPIMAFPGHIAPNDLLFYSGTMFPEKYRNGAFIAFHGSWNRAPEPQLGYFVAFVPFSGSLPSGDWEIFANGFAGSEEIKNPGNATYRPCGLAEGPDGSLYVVDSNKGKIWRIFYN